MTFNSNKLTIKAQETIQNAVEIAQNYSNQIVEPEHILAAMLQDSSNIAASIINKTGANLDRIKIRIGEHLEKLPKVSGAGIGNQQLSINSGKLFDLAFEESKNLKDEFISTEHILLALTRSGGNTGKTLKEFGLTREIILSALKEIRGNKRVTSPTPEETYQALKKYGRNLNEMAQANKLDPVIGRDEEIRRYYQEERKTIRF